jgi:hypothetical protein
VVISNSRGPASLSELVARLGPAVRAATVDEAASAGELVIEAIPFGRYRDLPAERLRGKIVVTALNYAPQHDGEVDLGGGTQSELVARHLAGARVVKAFNTIWFKHLESEGDRSKPEEERRVIALSGDDPEASAVVADLIRELGFGPLLLGPLSASARQEPGAPIYDNDLSLAAARDLLGG